MNSEVFKPGVYRHYKGDRYYAFWLSEDSTNGPNGESTQELNVVYMSLAGPKAGKRCHRKLSQWTEQVKVTDIRGGDACVGWVSRFEWVSP